MSITPVEDHSKLKIKPRVTLQVLTSNFVDNLLTVLKWIGSSITYLLCGVSLFLIRSDEGI